MINNTQMRVIEILKKNITLTDTEIASLSPDTNISQIGINSITFIKLIVALEKEFAIEFEEFYLDYSKFPDIGSISLYIESILNTSK